VATGRLPDPNTAPVTAKGDLYTYSTVPAKLAVGNNGDTLLADSSATTGLRWSSQPSASNPILNSAMQIWQRGTSGAGAVSSSTGFIADRWQAGRSAYAAGMTVSRQVTGDTTNLPFIQYSARVQRDSGTTATNVMFFTQNFESINSIPFAGKTITYSFYARAGANYSSASNALTASVFTGTGTDQNLFTTGYTGSATIINAPATLTTTWQRFSFTGTVNATATEMAVQVSYTPTGTAGANDWFEVTGVQLDVGSVALPFRTNAGTLQGELAAAQRYYWRAGGDSVFQYFGQGSYYNTTNGYVLVKNPVFMRTAPSSVDYSTLQMYDFSGTQNVTAVSLDSASKDVQLVGFTIASGGTQFRPTLLRSNNSTSGYIGFSAEL